MEVRKSIPDEIDNIVPELLAHRQQAFFPMLSVSTSDGQNIGFRDIAVLLHECFQFGTSQRIEKHKLLQIGRDLRIWNYQFRKNGVGSATFLAFDAKNAKNNSALACLESSSVIPMPNQAAGMTAIAVKSIQWKIRCNSAVDFPCYPLEACEISCYHIIVL